MLTALRAIAAIRKQGRKPECVLVEVGGKQARWWNEGGSEITVAIPDDVSLTGIDMRPLVGCHVAVLGDRSERTRKVLAAICQHAQSVAALTGTDADDLGHVWERGAGWRKFGGGA